MPLSHCLFCFQQVRIATGEPKEGDKRIEEFEKNRQIMKDSVTKIIKARRAGGNLDEVPLIDSMMQNYTSDDKVRDCR